MAVHVSSASTIDRSTTSRRNVRMTLGKLLVAIGMIVGVVGALFPATASAIQRPDTIPFSTWNADWGGGTWPPTADAGWPAVATNPSVSTRCGIDIAVVIDRSGSIADAGQGNNYRNAVKALIDEFAGTPSKVGVWSFANHASDTDASTYPWMQLTDVGGVNGPTNVTALNAKVDSIPIVSNFSTNWEEGIRAVLQAPVAASPRPDILIVLTDGQPTVHADDDSSGGETDNDDMAGGVQSANLVKANGTRILAVGVGPNVDVDGLKAISGNTAFSGGNIASADYLTTSFDDLRTSLKAFATALCGGSVTVTKLASTPQAPDTYDPAAGWAFTGTMTSPPPTPTVTPNDGVTLADGHVNFKWSSASAEEITITETPQAGFTLQDIVCLDNTGAAFPSQATANGVVLQVGPTDIVNCTFRNKAAAVDLTVTKSDGAISTTPGGTVPYVIGYRNAGTVDATGVVLTETVPANTTFSSAASTAGWSCANGSPAGTSCTFNVGTLAPSGSFTNVTFAVTTVSPLPGDVTQLSNTVSIAGTNENSNVLTNQASDTTPVNGLVDLTVTKTDGKTSTVPGDVLSYVLGASAVGDQMASGVVLHETVPANTTFNAAASTPGWSCIGSDCTFALGSLTPGVPPVNTTFAVTVANPLAAGVTEIANTVVISGTNENNDVLTNTASDTDTVTAAPHITVDKTDGVTTASPGDVLTYVITVTNDGNQHATGVQVIESVPAHTSFVVGDPANAGWVPLGGGFYGKTIDVHVGAPVQLTFKVQVDENVPADADTIDNLVTACLQTQQCDEGDDEDDLVAAPALSVSKDDSVTAAGPGDDLVYAITYENTGDRTASDLALTETVPVYTTADPAVLAGLGWVCVDAVPGTAAVLEAGSACTKDIGDLDGGDDGSATFSVTVDATVPVSADTVVNIVGLVDDEETVDTDDDIDELTHAPAISVEKTDGVTVVGTGDTLVYTITVSDTGSRDAEGVVVSESVPAYTSFDAGAPGNEGWAGPVLGVYTQTVDIPAGQDVILTFTVQVDDTVGVDAHLVENEVIACLGEACDDGDDDDELVADPLITIVKENEGNDDTVEAGEQIVYVITVSNEGDRDADHVVVYEEVPELTTFDADAPGNEGWADLGGGQYSMSGPLAAGESVTITFTVVVDATVPAGAELVHNDVAACLSSQEEPSAQLVLVLPDDAEVCVLADDDDVLEAAPDLSVVKSDGGFVADPGDDVTYTITYANNGDQDATGVVLTETVPVGSTFVGPDAEWSCTAGDAAGTVCTHAVGGLAAGASGSIAFTVKVNATLAAGQVDLDNVVVVADDGENGEDPTPGDNTGLDSTPITLPTVVLPNVVERPTQVAPTALPRTGSDSDRILLLAGVLTLLGGLLLLGESVMDQRRRRVVLRRR